MGGVFAAALASCEPQAGESSSSLSAAGDNKQASTPEAPVLVRLGKLERGLVADKLSVAADLEAIARADVPPEISGVVAEVLHREGDRVQKGEPVVRLVDEQLKLVVEQKRILAAQARAKIDQAAVASREGKELARQKRLLLDKAEAEYTRVKGLAEGDRSGIVSKEESDVKRYAFEQAQIDLSTVLIQGEKYTLEQNQAVESQKLAEVDLRTAEYNLSQATLRSPISGSITYLTVKVGETLGLTTRAFSVVDTSRLEARLHVPQKELARLKVAQPVRILCEVFQDREFAGEIEVVSPVVDKTNGTVEVIVGVRDPAGFLRPGMFVNGEIIVDTHENTVLVTKKAVSYENQEPILYLVKSNVAHRYVLKPGYSTKSQIEVLGLIGVDGLSHDPMDGELVEVGHNNLKEGSRVEIDRPQALREALAPGAASSPKREEKGSAGS